MNVAIPSTKETDSDHYYAKTPTRGYHLQPGLPDRPIPIGRYNLYHKRNTLLGLGKTDSVVAEVIDRVPPPEEGVTENGKRANGLGEIHSHECRDA